jgi:hypothetical protein
MFRVWLGEREGASPLATSREKTRSPFMRDKSLIVAASDAARERLVPDENFCLFAFANPALD